MRMGKEAVRGKSIELSSSGERDKMTEVGVYTVAGSKDCVRRNTCIWRS